MTQSINEVTPKTIEFSNRRIPVTIITGFLGSGKTTLLNQVLGNVQGLRVAVLMNEYGDIDIDGQLLIPMGEEIIELNNGCICCSINDGLVEAVYRILEQANRIDHIIIETTGIADPLPIALTFLGTDLRESTKLDSIITVVDSEAFTSDHFESDAALKQITYGDIIILNKTDLVSPEKVKELEAYIGSIKESSRILHSQYGQVPLPLILDVDCNNPSNYSVLVQEEIEQTEHDHYHSDDTHHPHEHHHHHSDHLDSDGFVSISFESDRPFDIRKFESFLRDSLPKEVFRAKGILWFTDSEFRNIFQLSGPRFDLRAEPWKTSPKNQLVLIGRCLHTEQLQQQLTECLR